MKMILAIGLVLVALQAMAEGERVDQRQQRQEQRIDNGIESGQLTQGEARRAEARQQHIDNVENRMRADDGRLDRQERRVLNRKQNKASRQIHRMKHNNRRN